MIVREWSVGMQHLRSISCGMRGISMVSKAVQFLWLLLQLAQSVPGIENHFEQHLDNEQYCSVFVFTDSDRVNP